MDRKEAEALYDSTMSVLKSAPPGSEDREAPIVWDVEVEYFDRADDEDAMCTFHTVVTARSNHDACDQAEALLLERTPSASLRETYANRSAPISETTK